MAASVEKEDGSRFSKTAIDNFKIRLSDFSKSSINKSKLKDQKNHMHKTLTNSNNYKGTSSKNSVLDFYNRSAAGSVSQLHIRPGTQMA